MNESIVDASENGRKIALIVDDEKVIATTLSLILTQFGFDARPAFSGEEALDLIDALRPHLLITDVVMPGMTGIELAIRTRSRLPSCKILLFSGQSAASGLLANAKAQGHDFEILAKPIHPTDLVQKLLSDN